MLKQKRREVGDKAGKLKGGLQKLQETGEQVADMQIVCQNKKVVVAEAKTSCEQLLVAIVQDKRVADEQEKQVTSCLEVMQAPNKQPSCICQPRLLVAIATCRT